MLLRLHAFTTLYEENKYSLQQSPQEKNHYRRRNVTKLTQGLKKSKTPSENLKTDCASNFSVDPSSGNFRKIFVRDTFQTRTETSSGANATSSKHKQINSRLIK